MSTASNTPTGVICATIKGILSAKKARALEMGSLASRKLSIFPKKSTAIYMPTTVATTIQKYFSNSLVRYL